MNLSASHGKKPLIGIAGFGHETVTFQPGTTDLAEFERIAVHDREVLDRRRGTNTVLGGYIEACEQQGSALLPVCDVEPEAGAMVTDRAFEFYSGRICRTFAEAREQLDGVLLYLHGAMVTESHPCAERTLLERLRRMVGPELPIVVSFDLHGNLDPALPELIDALVGYHSSPHVDMAATGKRAARILLRRIAGSIDPVWTARKPGIVVPSVFSATTTAPAKEVMARVQAWRDHPGVLDVSFLFGFAWSDVPQIGCSAVAVTDGDRDLAETVVGDLCALARDLRGHLSGRGNSQLLTLQAGVSRALQAAAENGGPVLILDHADRTNDTTFVLSELIRQEADKVAVPLFRDPHAVQCCEQAGQGAEVSLMIGGKTGWRDNGPLPFEGVVEWIGRGSYRGTGPMTEGLPVDLGPTAIVRSPRIWLQLVSHGAVLIDRDPFQQFGYEPEDFDIIVSKSKTHFRAVYEEVARQIVIVDAPGQCPADLGAFQYRSTPPGVFPITSI